MRVGVDDAGVLRFSRFFVSVGAANGKGAFVEIDTFNEAPDFTFVSPESADTLEIPKAGAASGSFGCENTTQGSRFSASCQTASSCLT